MNNILDLPKDQFVPIIEFLDNKSLGVLYGVNTLFRNLLSTHTLLIGDCWRRAAAFLKPDLETNKLNERVSTVQAELESVIFFLKRAIDELTDIQRWYSFRNPKIKLLQHHLNQISALTLDNPDNTNPLFVGQIPFKIKQAKLYNLMFQFNHPIPKDINSLIQKISLLKLKDFEQLEKFCQSADIMKIWYELAKTPNTTPVDFILDAQFWSSSDNVIKKSQEFSSWFTDANNATPLGNLTNLDLNDLHLTHLPSKISSSSAVTELFTILHGLTSLGLFNNSLSSLQEELGNLSLTFLDIGKNRFETIPECVYELQTLSTLGLQDNRISKISKKIERLAKILILRLDFNAFENLPEEIFSLNTLLELEAHHNQISEISPNISKLTQLWLLKLDNNLLKDLPSEIGKLPLTILSLRNNQLNSLPKELANIPNLLELYIYGNPLKELPRNYKWNPHIIKGSGSLGLSSIALKNTLMNIPVATVWCFLFMFFIGYFGCDSIASLK